MDHERLELDEEPKWKQLFGNPKIQLAAALAVGLVIGSGATWATMKTDPPKKSRAAMVEQRSVDKPVTPVQSSKTASKPASTKRVPIKVALKECNKITNKDKKSACIRRTKKAYAKHTTSTTKRTSKAGGRPISGHVRTPASDNAPPAPCSLATRLIT